VRVLARASNRGPDDDRARARGIALAVAENATEPRLQLTAAEAVAQIATAEIRDGLAAQAAELARHKQNPVEPNEPPVDVDIGPDLEPPDDAVAP